VKKNIYILLHACSDIVRLGGSAGALFPVVYEDSFCLVTTRWAYHAKISSLYTLLCRVYHEEIFAWYAQRATRFGVHGYVKNPTRIPPDPINHV